MPSHQGYLHDVSVLLVEQDSFCASYVGRGLADAGAHVLGPFASASDALHSIEVTSPPPVAAVLGLGEGSLDGLALALAGRKIPYVLMNRSQNDAPEPGSEDHPCFCKPFGAFQIVEAVGHIAAQPR